MEPQIAPYAAQSFLHLDEGCFNLLFPPAGGDWRSERDGCIGASETLRGLVRDHGVDLRCLAEATRGASSRVENPDAFIAQALNDAERMARTQRPSRQLCQNFARGWLAARVLLARSNGRSVAMGIVPVEGIDIGRLEAWQRSRVRCVVRRLSPRVLVLPLAA